MMNLDATSAHLGMKMEPLHPGSSQNHDQGRPVPQTLMYLGLQSHSHHGNPSDGALQVLAVSYLHTMAQKACSLAALDMRHLGDPDDPIARSE